jgi:hypothetical protein
MSPTVRIFAHIRLQREDGHRQLLFGAWRRAPQRVHAEIGLQTGIPLTLVAVNR